MINVTDSLIEYLYRLSNKELPEKVYKKAESCLLDYIGVTFAGAKINEKVFSKYNFDKGSCSLFEYGKKTDALTAAFVNGFNAHTVELDDGHRFGMIHLGGAIISSVLAVTQKERLPYERVIKGIVLGYETAARIALSIQPSHKKIGFHTSGTCGTIGSAAGAAVAMGADKEQLKAIVSAAATSAAGLLEIQEDASNLKPYNVGNAAMSGVNAAYIGMTGLCGPKDILGGDRGMLRLMSHNLDIDKLIEHTEYYEIERIYVKPYAACRHCHSSMEAIMKLKEKFNIPLNEIKEIEVSTYKLAVKGHNHIDIQGVSSAKLSIPYSVSATYILNRGDLEAFSIKNIRNKEILELTKKVRVVENNEFSQLSSKKRISEVKIITLEGREFIERIDYAKGEPENPMDFIEIKDKFYKLMCWSENKQIGMEIIKMIDTGNKDKLLEII